MNILHHKSWHVRNKNNIERVRRDEAQAADEEKERQRKIALAEQEARTDLLRKRAKDRHRDDQIEHSADKIPRIGDSDEVATSKTADGIDVVTDIYTHAGHINFFKDIETGDVKQGKNTEHEEEKNAEKEKWEKDIGLLTYLGQSSVESKEKAPWYLSGRKREMGTLGKREETLDPVEKDRKLKSSLDPLNQMTSYIHKKEQKHKHKHGDKEKHDRNKHKKRSREKESRKPDKHSSATKTVEQLRAERLNRERQERQRALDLLSGGQGQKGKVMQEPVNDRDRGYNSVFNPDFVRKSKPRHSYEDKY